jgi:hypothetical protein
VVVLLCLNSEGLESGFLYVHLVQSQHVGGYCAHIKVFVATRLFYNHCFLFHSLEILLALSKFKIVCIQSLNVCTSLSFSFSCVCVAT